MQYWRAQFAYLSGYEGPFFPPAIDDLNSILAKNPKIAKRHLLLTAMLLKGFECKPVPVTSDGYEWLIGLFFKVKEDHIVILIPQFKANRSIAIYKEKGIHLWVINRTVLQYKISLISVIKRHSLNIRI